MADDPSGTEGTPDGDWNGPSATDPDVEATADSSEDEGATTDRTEETSTGVRRERDEADDGWDRIPLDLSGSSDDESPTEGEPDDEYTPEASSTPIESGDPDLENALFVILGAIAMVLVFARLVMISLG